MAAAPASQQTDRISAGVSAGIITSEQALALRQLPLDSAPERFASISSGDEPFALFRGFRDVFLTLGIIALAIGLGGVSIEVFGLQFDGTVDWGDIGLTAGLALIAWGVAEWVTARLRMPLASLVTATAFSVAFAATLLMLLSLVGLVDLDHVSSFYTVLALIAGSALLFYLRFRLPFTMALIAGSLTFVVYRVIEDQMGNDADLSLQIHAGLVGLVIFLVAIVFELRDRARQTRFSENAFWLHLLGAPLIVFSLTGGTDAVDISSTSDAIRVFVIVAVLGIVALMIDRRAFIVAALIYFAGAIAYTINQSGMPSDVQFAATALILGLFVVGLALGWQPLRHAFLHLLPDRLSERLPNPAGPDVLGG